MKHVIIRFAVILLATVAAFIVLYFAAVLAGGLITNGHGAIVRADAELEMESLPKIYLDNNGRHIDIWLPVEYFKLPGAIPTSGQTPGGWYGFGWGDRNFFLNTPHAGDVEINYLLKAIFTPSKAVLAMQYSSHSPEGRPSAVEIAVTEAAIKAAADYIFSWFLLNEEGLLQKVSEAEVHQSYTGYTFYESRGYYSLFFTSNNWVNTVLRAAGISTGLWTPFTFGVGRGA